MSVGGNSPTTSVPAVSAAVSVVTTAAQFLINSLVTTAAPAPATGAVKNWTHFKTPVPMHIFFYMH